MHTYIQTHLAGMPVTFLKGAVLFGGDNTLTQQADAAGMQDHAPCAVLGVVHLRLTHTLTTQHSTTVHAHTAEGREREGWRKDEREGWWKGGGRQERKTALLDMSD